MLFYRKSVLCMTFSKKELGELSAKLKDCFSGFSNFVIVIIINYLNS